MNPMPLPRLEQRSYAAGAARHRHDFHQLVLPRAGLMQIEIAGRAGTVSRQGAAFIPSGHAHAFEVRGDHGFLVVDLARDGLAGGRGASAAIDQLADRIFFPMSPALDHLVAYAAGFAGQRLPDPSAWVDLLLATAAPAAERSASGPVSRAQAHIEANLDSPPSIAVIARAAGASPRRLHRLFREELGTTPHAYLARRRGERVLDLLARTSLPIAEIAHLTGHADQSALTRALKRSHGVTPAAYRRRHGGRGDAETAGSDQ
ncbi:AraC family transcriptional regulator [Rhodobacteraceae bacterium DSL-40]|uniref:AraC family transcriptional regulator n=1 Tax=Amaricoccus sp. B4 TaxID=3368557 RepID=UPI000DAB48FB